MKMMMYLKCFKSFSKLSLLLITVIAFSTLLNKNLSGQKTRRLSLWKINYDPFNLKKRFRATNMKYVLLWTHESTEKEKTWRYLKDKQVSFEENKCQYNNCFVTTDKTLLGGDYRNFDAIIINVNYVFGGVNLKLPTKRSLKQLYIFESNESSDNYPICKSQFEDYFNLTWTYRLDSDVPWPYFFVYDKESKEVGPRTNMHWIPKYDAIDEKDKVILTKKKCAATWFVSNCFTRSRRETLFYNIKTELRNKYKLDVDSLGFCGSEECAREKDAECQEKLKKYYFYFSFENSIAQDYVTEKVLKAFLQYTVPVVFGGANYSRFLPPHSYIDASLLSAKETAAKMAYLIRNQTAYLEYFRWRHHYYYKPSSKAVCRLCECINRNAESESIKTQFREWWQPSYTKICKDAYFGGNSN